MGYRRAFPGVARAVRVSIAAGGGGGSGSSDGFVAIIGETSLLLNFAKVSNAAYYKIQRSTDNASWSSIGEAYASVGPRQLYSATGLSTGVLYYFRVRAEDEDQVEFGSWSASFSATTVASEPDLPTYPAIFNTKYSLPGGNTWTATNTGSNNAAGSGAGNRTGCGLQYALTNCAAGDIIEVTAGGTYSGQFSWPDKGSTTWTYLRTSAYSSLPAPLTRVGPSDEANMATLQDSTFGFLSFANSSGYLRCVGIRFRPTPGNTVTNFISIGHSDTSLSTLSTHVIFDRCVMRGDATLGTRRTMDGSGRYIALIDCYVYDIKDSGSDSQAFWAYNGDGPYLLRNNYLEASCENIMFGGAQPPSQNASFIPQDIAIIDNYIFKPLAWQGSAWQVKNLLELKLGIRVLIQYNKLENCWPQGQAGYSILLSPRDEASGAPFFPDAQVADVGIYFTNSINTVSAMQISGADDGDVTPGRTSQRLNRPCIYNAMFLCRQTYNTSGGPYKIWTPSGCDYSAAIGGPKDLIISHCTTLLDRTTSTNMAFNVQSTNVDASRMRYKYNINEWGLYGSYSVVAGSSNGAGGINGIGTDCTDGNFTWTSNVMIDFAQCGVSSSTNPSGNFIAPAYSDVGFVNYAGGNYRIDPTSAYYQQAPNSQSYGCNIDWIPA